MANQKNNLKFMVRSTNKAMMPCVVIGGETYVGSIASYNSFPNKESVNKYLGAQKTLAKHFGLEHKFEQAIKEYELVQETSYIKKISL